METERTTLTLLQEADLPAMTIMSRELGTFRYIRKLGVMTDEQYQEFLKLKLEQIRLKTGYHWAVWLKDGGDFIGAVNLNPIGSTNRLQIGCQLRQQYWAQGFASELTRRVLDFAVGEAGLKEVYGVFEKENAASRRLLEKLGFTLMESKTESGVEVEIHRFLPHAVAGGSMDL
jgi:ribosomal-protein-alanine N-acetyltransferase